MKRKLQILVLGIFAVTMVFGIFSPGSAVAEPIKLSYASFVPSVTFVGVQL